jgi:hypothetical protein
MGAAGGVGGCDSAGSRVRARAAKLQPERRPRWSLIRFPAGDRLGAAPIRFGASARVDRRQSAARNRSRRAAAQEKDQLRIARNEIYALRFPWYRPNTWEVTLNAVGQANVTLIQSTVIRAICAALALAVALATPAVQGT